MVPQPLRDGITDLCVYDSMEHYFISNIHCLFYRTSSP